MGYLRSKLTLQVVLAKQKTIAYADCLFIGGAVLEKEQFKTSKKNYQDIHVL